MKKLRILLSFKLVLFSINAYADKANQATQLLNYFKSSCSVVNDWTNQALTQTQSMIETLNAIKNDQDCSSAAGSINNLQTIQMQLQQLQYSETQKEILALENQEQVLMNALQATSDPATIDSISNELRAVQTQLAGLNGYQSYDDSFQGMNQTQVVMQAMIANTEQVFKSLTSSQACWNNYPGVLSSVGGLAGSIVGAVSSSGYSIIINAAIELFSQVVTYARKWSIQRKINQAASPLASTAFHCALENMSKVWCSAEDAKHAIKLTQNVLTQDSDDALWVGVKIIDRELPLLLKWLKKVRAGTQPMTQADAERQNRAIFRETSVRTIPRTVQGIISQNTDNFATAGDASAKWSIQRQMIKDIVIAAANHNTGIFAELIPQSYAYYYLLGLSKEEAPFSDSLGDYNPIDSFDPFTYFTNTLGRPFNPNIQIIEDQFDEWVRLATIKVQNELNQVLQVSPLEVLDDAIYNGGRPYPTPRDAIKTIIKFLHENAPQSFTFNHHRLIYLDTIDILNTIGTTIDQVFTEEIKPSDALATISEVSKLNFGTVLIESRVLRSARYTLNDIVISRRSQGDNLASQLLAADDIVEQLRRYHPSGSSSLTSILEGINQAQTISQANLNTFVKQFGTKIKRILKYYDELAQRSGEGDNGPNKRSKASLCLKLLSLDKWPKKIPFELCQGSQLTHTNESGPKSIELTLQALNKPFKEKVCRYRDYLRAAEIFEKYRINILNSN